MQGAWGSQVVLLLAGVEVHTPGRVARSGQCSLQSEYRIVDYQTTFFGYRTIRIFIIDW